MVQTKSYEYYTHRERPYLPTKRLREGDVRSTEHDSSGQETGFYPWFQMLFGTSGTAVIMKDSFISVFYNDLLVISLNSIYNISFTNHGIITNTDTVARLACHSFKLLNN